jgi:EAL domain-containing protein (putative c-di-GMP-specific phosphodiesterase class I)
MVVFYQPIVELPSRSIVRAEALCRFPETAGLKTPADYITYAEDQGLVRGLTDLVLAQSLGFWRRLGSHAPAQLAINLSPMNLLEVDLGERIFTALAKTGVEASRLVIEIDERILSAHDDVSRDNIRKLVDAGIHFSMDGFGPSLSPVIHLQLTTLPLSELKVDRDLILDLDNDAERRSKLRTIVDVAETCGLELAAKGVEDEATVAAVTRMGFNRMQGYHVAPPMGEPEFEAWLARQRPAVVVPVQRKVSKSYGWRSNIAGWFKPFST